MPAGQAFARREVVGFVGFTSKLRAEQASIARTINLILEPTEPGNLKAPMYLRKRPGLSPFGQVMDSPGNTISTLGDRGFIPYGVTGTSFWQIASNGATITWGTVTLADWNTSLPAQIVSNGTAGNQLLIISGGDGYVFDLNTNTLTEINNTNFPGTAFPSGQCSGIEFMDGYGIALTAGSREFHISALEDFTLWDPLDVAQRSEAADNLVSVTRVGRQLMFLGVQTGEAWSDNGDALFPFAPIPGTFIEWGSCSPTAVRYRDTLVWLGQSVDGRAQVMTLNGYTPVPLSTPAVDLDLQAASQLAQNTARLWTCQMQAHWWVGVTLSDRKTTWVYDNLSHGWVEWAMWNTTTSEFEPFLASAHANNFNKQLITDSMSGVIYELSFDAYDDSIV